MFITDEETYKFISEIDSTNTRFIVETRDSIETSLMEYLNFTYSCL